MKAEVVFKRGSQLVSAFIAWGWLVAVTTGNGLNLRAYATRGKKDESAHKRLAYLAR
jgi:hypothetical protein